ncbi:MAG: hypothetical protein IT444_02430 [Phycisphaeraceae bacterium]|nr:hypothetical protein [Phycisphaeraceae bacterium]
MENRFGFKDLIIAILLIAVLLSIWLAMKQYDRQYEVIQAVSNKLDAQTRDLEAMRRTLDRGIAVTVPASAATQQTTDAADPFARIRTARKMPDFAEGGWYIDAFSGVAKLTPLVSGDVYASVVQDSILETLLTRDPETLEYQGLIARSWEVIDNTEAFDAYVKPRLGQPLTVEEIVKEPDCPAESKEADARAVRDAYIARRMKEGKKSENIANDPACPPAALIKFVIRDGVSFSDGHPLTADDVVFTFNFVMDERIAAPRQRAYLRMIRSVGKTGPNEVTFSFREPYFESLELAGSIQVLPKHFYGSIEPEKFNQSVGLLMGSGPYRLPDPRTWSPGETITLVRNDRYWGVRPAFDRLVYRQILNDVAKLTAFRNGEIDVLSAFPEQYRDMLADADLVRKTQHFDYASPVGGYRFVAWNQMQNGKPTIFADKRVRRAMTMLIDRQRLIHEVMLGYATEATGPFNPASQQCSPDVKPLPFDIDGAKKLLADAGFADRDGDGLIESADGRPFRFKLTYPSGNANYEAQTFFMKDSFARAGILLEPDPLEWTVFTERLSQKNFDAITLAWSAGIETDIYQMFHSSQMVPGGDDFISYRNVELDGLIDRARRMLNEHERMPLWRRAHEILYEDQPYTFLFFPKSLRFVDGRIRNVQLLKLGMNSREEWFVPEQFQRTSTK